jgi:hypothetical protein
MIMSPWENVRIVACDFASISSESNRFPASRCSALSRLLSGDDSESARWWPFRMILHPERLDMFVSSKLP